MANGTQRSSSTTIAFIVGGLVVAVAILYFVFSGGDVDTAGDGGGDVSVTVEGAGDAAADAAGDAADSAADAAESAADAAGDAVEETTTGN